MLNIGQLTEQDIEQAHKYREGMRRGMEKMLTATQAERIFIAENHFGIFCLWYFMEYFKYELDDYHYLFMIDIEDLSTALIREVLWVGYRESAKTTLAQLGVTWFLIFKKKTYVNADSYASANSERSLFDIAHHLINNKRLIGDFGKIYDKGRDLTGMKQSKVNNFTTENGCRIEASTTQIDVRGRKHFQHRPNFRWVDDFETHDTKDSPVITEDIKNNITSAMGGLAPDASQLYTANYLTEYGNVQWLFERSISDPNIRVRNIPVILANGQPAWRAKYALTDEEAKLTGKVSLEDKKRQLGSQVFSYEMMNTPIDETTAEFKRAWIKRITQQEVDRMQTRNFGTIDPAYSQENSADDIGVTINKVSSENKWYIKAFGIKMTPLELIHFMFVVWDRDNLEAWGVEEGVFDLVIKPFLDIEMRKRNKFITVIKIKHNKKNKQERIRGLLPRYESGSIFHIDGECEKLEEQMRVFPKGLHDDVLDSEAMQEQIAIKPSGMAEQGYTPISSVPTYKKNMLTGKITYS